MNCLFCEIINKKIKSDIILMTSKVIIIQDIKPQAPIHLLIIPTEHIPTIDEINQKNIYVINNIILNAKLIAEKKQINKKGYRLIFNVNKQGGQKINHIHLHLLAGRQMKWPPG
ncbi:histidine triad nucleotide-binding protein [Candidatus Legionella polyplacis]|uniref:HIT domain-containing protein n=1 Tax=Candidatus Legionella polyplacis TaxID=2005262 RepID=A0ABZ2H008_9GAMM|nr:HIT domain-containing protein [Candidatus Legionella polyplacis]ATW01916.1 histidine triad nucleotide-binding protein [Candidatus Legionella polyplacis]